MLHLRRLVASLLLTPLWVWPAEAQNPSALSGQVRDSAGISIVDHRSIPGDLPQWRIDQAAEMTLGGRDADGPEVFSSVAGAVELSSGVIVIAEANGSELIAFDPMGGRLWSRRVARTWAGETRELRTIYALPGDTLLVDGLTWAEVWDYDGKFIRTVPLGSGRQAAGAPTLDGVLSNGTLVGRTSIRRPQDLLGLVRPPNLHSFLDGDGRVIESIAIFPGTETLVAPQTGGGPDAEASRAFRVPMRRETVVSVSGTTVAIGDQSRFEIQFFDSIGTLRRVLRVQTELIPPDSARAQGRANAPPPATLPAFGRILLEDGGDRLWVQEYVPGYDERRPRWWVFGPAGEFIAEASFPVGFTPFRVSAGSTSVLGAYSRQAGLVYVQRRGISPVGRVALR